MAQERKILLGLTTTPGSDWKEKTNEIVKYNLKEVALFPTFLKIKDRKKLYQLLEKTPLQNIPHVHLRDDMEDWEIKYFLKKYKTQVFNIHSKEKDALYLEKNPSLSSRFFVENADILPKSFFELVERCGGVCLDVSHFYDFGVLQKEKTYQGFLEFLKKTKVGCCHISAIQENPTVQTNLGSGKKTIAYSKHFLHKLTELNYVREYRSYLPEIISIELENSFEEQLEFKEYLRKNIFD